MINYIWIILIIISLICAFITGKVPELATSLLSGTQETVDVIFSTVGLICFWSGIMEIAEKSGVTDILSKLFSPILGRIFNEIDKNGKAFKAICMNVTANLLGLGNAATPFGIKAMQEMAKENRLQREGIASNSMVLFVVINTASLQLIPTMVAGLRMKHGSEQPFDILPIVWIVSFCSLTVGIVTAKLIESRDKTCQA